jgi:hypothetical protein
LGAAAPAVPSSVSAAFALAGVFRFVVAVAAFVIGLVCNLTCVDVIKFNFTDTRQD